MCPHCGEEIAVGEKYRNPFPTVDVIMHYQGGVVLIERGNPPYGWAIPGGFVEYGESAETTAVREMEEETALSLQTLTLYTVRSDPERDPRFHTLTVVFAALGEGAMTAGDDAANARVFPWDKLPDQIAFDHRDVLESYKATRLFREMQVLAESVTEQ
jgi:ADP-ribose pyrophosphatase YjhB (NUDIX family)